MLEGNAPVLSVSKLHLSFGKDKILDNLSFKIFAGEYVGLIGPNGAGKSSLLLSIMNYYKPTSGKIILAPNTTIGYVPQNLHLQSQFSMSVAEFLSMGIHKKLAKNCKQEIMEETLQDVGLSSSFLQKNFHLLSGGQKQRIVIARSIIHKPNFLLFDEPLKGIDNETKIKIYQLLARLNQKYAITILFVSHEIHYVVEQTSRVLCLDKKLYEGCHPFDFQGAPLECAEEKGKNFPKKTTPIHHHH
jgi:zinc transport system ATP-binding protein